MTLIDLLKNFFTHKDYLNDLPVEVPGKLFTPMHFIVAALWVALITLLVLFMRKKSEKTLRITFAVIWAVLVALEITKMTWESFSGKTVGFEYGGILPLYPCSVFMYAMPFAIFGKGLVRKAAAGYVCSLGLVGALINFVYPANILQNYSAISFSGFHTFFYHGAMLFTAAVMLCSGYHSYKNVQHFYELLLPSAPFVAVSLIANAVNFSWINSDYMFFKLNSFLFVPIGEALGTPLLTVPLVYLAYLIVHALPYLPSFLANKVAKKKA